MDKGVRRQLIVGGILTAVSLTLLQYVDNNDKHSKIVSYERSAETGEIEEKQLDMPKPSYNRVLKK